MFVLFVTTFALFENSLCLFFNNEMDTCSASCRISQAGKDTSAIHTAMFTALFTVIIKVTLNPEHIGQRFAIACYVQLILSDMIYL